MYTPGNFLNTYASTDIILSLFNSIGKKTNNINVCQIEKIAVEDKEVWISLHDSPIVKLDFPTTSQASLGYMELLLAYNALVPNCRLSGGPIQTEAVPLTIIPITLANYIAAAVSNALIPLQCYDIQDTLPVFNLGATIRVIAKVENDVFPEGVSILTKKLVTLDVLNSVIIKSLDPDSRTQTENRGSITAINNSTDIIAKNNSTVVADNSDFIEVDGFSSLTVTDSNNINVRGKSTIILNTAERCTFDNITVDLSTYPGEYNDIVVDSSNTIGKTFREGFSTSKSLFAYINGVEQFFDAPLGGNVIVLLDNKIAGANAKFVFYISANIGNFVLTVTDKNGAQLATIDSIYVGSKIEFVFNKSTGLFELAPEQLQERVVTIPVGVDGQVLFVGALPTTPKFPLTAKFELNGVQQVYGGSADYVISGQDILWYDRFCTLSTTDEITVSYI